MRISLNSAAASIALTLFFLACGVAADAIFEVGNAFFTVLAVDFAGFVFVAAVAGIVLQGAGMADLAVVPAALAVSDGESMRLVEASQAPGVRRVTIGARGGKQTGMELRFGVAGSAFLRGSREDTLHVAALTGRLRMSAGERKIGLGMVEVGFLPARGRVAAVARRSKFTVVSVILGVAGKAILGCIYEAIFQVAILAGDAGVTAHQREASQVVIKIGLLPTFGVVAAAAILPEPPCVGVILRVAGEAVLRRGPEINQGARIHMAGGAIRIDMLAHE